MKKSIQLLILIFCILITGCSSTKKIKEENTLLKSEIQNRDSSKNTVINQPIDDKLITPIVQSQTGNQSFDSIVNAKVDEILTKLNLTKSSGENGYVLIYDKLRKQLEFNARIARTQSENLKVYNENSKVIIQEKKIPVEIVKPLSKMEKLLMILGILAIVYTGIRVVLFLRKASSTWA